MLFDEALKDSVAVPGNRHLLLGNGFSIACRKDAFSYDRLFDEANFGNLSVEAETLFGLSSTSDFEQVIESLRISASVLDLYDPSQTEILDRVQQDTETLKVALADVLSRKHPDNVGVIRDAEYESARRFLVNFNGNIYTVSYDLLLYWTLQQEMKPIIKCDDGFRADPEDQDAEWVTWDGYAGHGQRIFYLHGGLHLYDAGTSVKKLTWKRTGVSLIDQIRDALDTATYPLVVTEGSSHEKLARIEHAPYLHRGFKSLAACGGSLFIYGHSLDANDDHVLARIEQGGFEAVYVSLHGDPESPPNRTIRHRAGLLADRRDEHEAGKPANKRRPLRIEFFDADSARVWVTSW